MKTLGRLLIVLVLLAAAGAGGYAVWLERQDRAQIAELKKVVDGFEPRFAKLKTAMGEVSKGLTSMVLDEIDLTRSGWQPIGKGFYLVDPGVEPQDKGVRIHGKIINATSVVHEDLLFTARLAKSAAAISLPRAAPGVALPFEVTVPNVTAADGKRATIELASSTISYASTSAKTAPARESFDPEKILKTAN